MQFEDLTGKIFGDLKVIERDFAKKKTAWICECLLCGKKVSVMAYNLKNGNSTNCGCKRNKAVSERSRKDLTGRVFGQLRADALVGSDKHGHSIYSCTCLRCGRTFEALGTNILSGKIVSCGCIGAKNRTSGREKALQEAKELGTNIGKIKASAPLKSNKTTGIRGVCYIKSQGKYKAYITFKNVRYVLKYSSDIEECIKARKEAEEKLFGDFLKWYEEYKK